MREEILRQLRQVTEEEKKLLAGDPVDRTLYCSSGGFIIDSEKLLAKGQLIAPARPHALCRLPHAQPQLRGDHVHYTYIYTVHRIEATRP